jgi:hypothetical protein
VSGRSARAAVAHQPMADSARRLIIDKCRTGEALRKSVYNHVREALFLFERGPLTLVAGAGFEPVTSGL